MINGLVTIISFGQARRQNRDECTYARAYVCWCQVNKAARLRVYASHCPLSNLLGNERGSKDLWNSLRYHDHDPHVCNMISATLSLAAAFILTFERLPLVDARAAGTRNLWARGVNASYTIAQNFSGSTLLVWNFSMGSWVILNTVLVVSIHGHFKLGLIRRTGATLYTLTSPMLWIKASSISTLPGTQSSKWIIPQQVTIQPMEGAAYIWSPKERWAKEAWFYFKLPICRMVVVSVSSFQFRLLFWGLIVCICPGPGFWTLVRALTICFRASITYDRLLLGG